MIIAVTTTKGGAGKTTITINLATEFARKGYQVCIIDADAGQFSALKWARYRDDDQNHISVFQVAKDKLNREAKTLNEKFDIVIIDGRPTASEVGDRIVMASDIVIIPVMPSVFDLEAFQEYIPRFLEVKNLKEDIGGKVAAYALLNGLVVNSNISTEIKEAVSQIVEDLEDVHVFKTKLMRRVAYSNSPTNGLGVVEENDSKARQEIQRLAMELETEISKFN